MKASGGILIKLSKIEVRLPKTDLSHFNGEIHS